MLHDRDYMREDGRSGNPLPGIPVTAVIMIVLVIAFGWQQLDSYHYRGSWREYFALSNAGLRHGFVWQLLTFQFLHANLWHLIGNLVGLWCFGFRVEERLGRWNFIKLYLLSGVAGGLLQSLLGWVFPDHFGGAVVGASAGISGLLAAFALLDPETIFLAYFVIPIRVKLLLYLALAVSLFFTAFPYDSNVAHAAHLGGLLFAMAFLRWGLSPMRSAVSWNPVRRKLRRESMLKAATAQPAKMRRRPKVTSVQDLPSEEFIAQEVDPILDKISAHGIQSLTDRERAILQAARAKMSKH